MPSQCPPSASNLPTANFVAPWLCNWVPKFAQHIHVAVAKMSTSTVTPGLACKRSAGRFARHAFFNDFIRRSLASVMVLSVLEPAGLSRTDGKRPDGVTAIPWQRGKPLVWDVTFVDSLAPSRAQQQGSSSTEAETQKTLKYANIEERGNIFQPLAIDVQGNYGT